MVDEWKRRFGECGRDSDKALKTYGGSTQAEKQKKVCHYCHKEGHYRRDCRKFAEDRNGDTRVQPQRAKITKDDEHYPSNICFSVRMAESCENTWFLDSGATSHMTSNAAIITSVTSEVSSSITLADGNKVLSQRTGSGNIVTVDEHGEQRTVTLKQILYVPELKGNLLSVSKMADEGCTVVFNRTGCKVLKDGHVVVVGERNGCLYQLKQPEAAAVAATHREDCQHSWHRRLGHRDPKALKRIVDEKMGTDLTMVDCGIRSVCTICSEAKMNRAPFPPSESRADAVLDLVHTDLCGPIDVPTPRGNRYVMTMIDDHSRYSTIYLLKNKSEAEEKIKEFVELVANQFGKKPRVIRSDGGGEYSSVSLGKYLRQNGIVLQQTVPYSPQQNGVAERKNRSLMDMMRCLLAESNLPTKYWGEAVTTANFLQNRPPSSSVPRTPHEIWTGRLPCYKHLHVFGSEALVHVPAEKRRKCDMKARRMIFVGYEENRKGFRFLDVATSRITISRDAIFLDKCPMKDTVRSFTPKQVMLHELDTEVPLGSSTKQQTAPLNESIEMECEFEGFSDEEEQEENVQLEEEPIVEEPRRSTRNTKGMPPSRYGQELHLARSSNDEPTRLTDKAEPPPNRKVIVRFKNLSSTFIKP